VSLSDFQQRVASIVFALPASTKFALAGGGALIAHEIVDRATNDLDCFGPSRDEVDRCWPTVRDALVEVGLDVDIRIAHHGFARLTVTDPATTASTEIDFGFDPADHDPVRMTFGPVRALDDLAGDKLLALFSRAAPRDFVDVHALRRRFSRRELEAAAAAKDLGFNRSVLRDAFGVLQALPRNAFEVDDATLAAMAVEFADWRSDLGESPTQN
jgi:Nucleotidyl transferase AbiEii toxin, Type IV TA system